MQGRGEAGGQRRGQVGAGAAEQGGAGVPRQDGGLCGHVHARGKHEELRRLEERRQDQHKPGKSGHHWLFVYCSNYSIIFGSNSLSACLINGIQI